MSYQEDLILSIYNRGEPGLAMGNIPPGKGGSPGQPYEAPKEDPKNPYVPAPKQNTDQFRSQQELIAAMSDTRYENDPAYRQDVMDKLQRSPNVQF